MQLFTAHPPVQRRLVGPVLLVAFLTLWHMIGATFGASAAVPGSVAGHIWEDVDRDGRFDADEPAWGGRGVALYDETGSYVDGAASDADGTWRIDGLAAGTYTAKMGSFSWQEVRDDWVPTTTSGVFPEAMVDVTEGGVATFDLGWRPITWSTDVSEPITTATTIDGVVVEAFNDAMHARDLVAALDLGSLRGNEATATTVRFAYSGKTYCGTSVSGVAGSYTNFRATCYVGYSSWLSRADWSLFHEYGHAWSQYHRTVANQWEDFSPYLEARGIDPNDDRLGSSHAWTPGEMIAEDFRQLFGSSNAQSYSQENQEIPPAPQVGGLATWLSTTFMGEMEDSGDTTSEDTQEPTVSYLVPTDGSTVAGTVTATVAVDDDTSGVDGLDVSVLLDGVAHAATHDADAGVWEATLDTTKVADGTAVLEAQATDEAGNTATMSHNVMVDNTTETTTEEDTTSTTEETSGTTVTSIATGTINHGGSWTAWVESTVTDAGAAVSGVVVDATWAGEGKHGGSGSVSCTTGADGVCRLSVDQPKRVPSVSVDVTSPSAASLTIAKP